MVQMDYRGCKSGEGDVKEKSGRKGFLRLSTKGI